VMTVDECICGKSRSSRSFGSVTRLILRGDGELPDEIGW
jgi:hypothetical protein